MILAGDIGGTKTNLALFKREQGHLLVAAEATYQSKYYTHLETVIREFLGQFPPSKPISAACFGVAGPVVGERCKISNLPWMIETAQLRRLLNCEEVSLINDLEAIGFGIPALSAKELFSLNPTASVQKGNGALLAAGTGLGEALLYWDGQEFRPSASEGGNVDFAPRNELQIELLRYLLKKFEHVSYEHVLSGPGLFNIYEFLRDGGYGTEPDWLKERLTQEDHAAVIAEVALTEENPLCIQALDLFVAIYGAEAGNLALKFMCFGGIYIGGGIAPKILPKLNEGGFMCYFVDKGRFADLTASMPVYVILNPKAGLIGAARWASLF